MDFLCKSVTFHGHSLICPRQFPVCYITMTNPLSIKSEISIKKRTYLFVLKSLDVFQSHNASFLQVFFLSVLTLLSTWPTACSPCQAQLLLQTTWRSYKLANFSLEIPLFAVNHNLTHSNRLICLCLDN